MLLGIMSARPTITMRQRNTRRPAITKRPRTTPTWLLDIFNSQLITALRLPNYTPSTVVTIRALPSKKPRHAALLKPGPCFVLTVIDFKM